MILLGNLEQDDLVLSWPSSPRVPAAPAGAPSCSPALGSAEQVLQHPEQLLHPSTATLPFPSLPHQKGELRKHLQVLAVPTASALDVFGF